MNKYIYCLPLFLLSLSLEATPNERYLGTFTIDNYPIDGCTVKKIGSLFSFTESGYSGQKKSIKIPRGKPSRYRSTFSFLESGVLIASKHD